VVVRTRVSIGPVWVAHTNRGVPPAHAPSERVGAVESLAQLLTVRFAAPTQKASPPPIVSSFSSGGQRVTLQCSIKTPTHRTRCFVQLALPETTWPIPARFWRGFVQIALIGLGFVVARFGLFPKRARSERQQFGKSVLVGNFCFCWSRCRTYRGRLTGVLDAAGLGSERGSRF